VVIKALVEQYYESSRFSAENLTRHGRAGSSIHFFHRRDECHADGGKQKGNCQPDHHRKRSKPIGEDSPE
jgi:hypothetical protein